MTNKTTMLIRLIFLLVLSLNFPYSFGQIQTDEVLPPQDTIISDPISVDSLFISPSLPREGDNVYLWAATTHSSSPCGLLNYTVLSSATNVIYVSAKYWEGMLTAICHSTDSMKIGQLKAGKYVLNFMNKKKIEFTVYPKDSCIADFTYMYPKCALPEKCINTVEFIDQSIIQTKSWYWDFGDETSSSLQNPIHHYASEGVYNVCLTVPSCYTNVKSITKCKLVPVPANKCKAQYTYQILEDPTMSANEAVIVPFPTFLVHFTDISVGNVIKWQWDFGDGSYSNLQNPTHRFRQGISPVTLHIATKDGCESKYTDSLVLYNPQPVCQYTGTVKDYSKLDGCGYIIELDNGLKINPVIDPTNFVFKDSQRVIIDYRPLKIATTCMVGIPAEITCIRELIVPECKAFFTYTKDTTADCICYNFYDQSKGKVLSWLWDFGDGTTSNLQNPKHVFSVSSVTPYYTVCLTITTIDQCVSTYCEKVYFWQNVPWVPVIGGKASHNILIPACLKSSVNLETGDFIGLFFRDYFGKLVCGGMMQWTENPDLLTAWANSMYTDSIIIMDDSRIPIPIRKNGFNPGEKFEYKIWKWRTNEEIDIKESEYTVTKSFPDSGLYQDNGMSLLKALVTADEQTFTLFSGWNLISLHVKPDDPRMSSIFKNLDVIVKDNKGDVVYPSLNKNIPVWDPYEGYKIKPNPTNTYSQITVSGTNIDPQTNIPLPGTLYPAFLPYYYTKPYPVVFMMSGEADNLRYLQTYEWVNATIKALNYIPKYNINQIKFMKPGLAYKFSLYIGKRSFTYPAVITPLDTIPPQNSQLKPVLPTGENNRVLIIPEKVLPITTGTLIDVFIGTKWVGYEYAVEGNNAVTMWDIDSSIGSDNFILQIMENEQIIRYNLRFSKNTEVDGDLNILTDITTNTPGLISEKLVIKVFPTLASQEFNIDLSLDKPQQVEVSLFDLLGQKVKEIKVYTASTGINRIIMQVGDVDPGQYFYQVKTTNKTQRGKILVIR